MPLSRHLQDDTSSTNNTSVEVTDPYSSSVVSAIGAFVALTTIFLFIATAYMVFRVYKLNKHHIPSREELDEAEKLKNAQKVPNRE